MMKAVFDAFGLLALMAGSAVAGSVNCNTYLGSTSVANPPIKSSTVTNTVQTTTTLISQSTTTVSQGLTSTATVYYLVTTKTTTTPATDTVTTTSTIITTSTETDISTVTTTSTEIDTAFSTSTTYSATTSGFQPIADTLNSINFPRKRELEHPHQVRAATTSSSTSSTSAAGVNKLVASSYTASVVCTSTATVTSTKTAYTTLPRTTVTTQYWAKHTTVVDFVVTTSTIYPPDVTSTATTSSTSTIPTTTTLFNTVTASTTTTTTSVLPGPTIWAACASNNQFGPAFTHNGVSYYASNVANNGPGVGSDFLIMANGAVSGTDCCNQCMSATSCETWLYRAQENNCFLMYHQGETCSSQTNHPNYIMSTKTGSSGTVAGYMVGNGMCGFTWSGNSDGTLYSVDAGSIPS